MNKQPTYKVLVHNRSWQQLCRAIGQAVGAIEVLATSIDDKERRTYVTGIASELCFAHEQIINESQIIEVDNVNPT